MKTILALLFSLSASWGITNVTLPYIVDTASIPKVKYVDKNDSALKWGVNNLGDTVNAATGTGALMRRTGATGVTLTSPTFSNPTSTGKIAADSLSVSGLTASQPIWTDAAKKLVSNAPTGTGTTLVLSASPTGTGTWSLPILNISGKTTLTDSLVGVAERLAGNLTLSNGTSGGPSINLNSTDIGGRNFVMASGGSANGAFRVGGWNLRDATAGVTRIIVDSLGATTFAGSVEAVGTLAADGQFAFAGNGSGTTAALWRDATNGINMRGIAGSANQLELWDKNGAALLSFSNSSGAATFPNAVSMSSTLGVTGVTTFTAPPVFSSVTASQILSVDGSKGLTSTATTGTGPVMLAASPTTTGTLNAAAITASGTVTADTLVSSKFYAEGSFTATITGMTTTVSGTAYYVRAGKSVTLFFPNLTGTSNSFASETITGLPVGITPSRAQLIGVPRVMDNGNTYSGYLFVNTNSVISVFFKDTLSSYGASWTNSGTKGLDQGATVTYTLQ